MSFMNGVLCGAVFAVLTLAVSALLDTLFDAVKGLFKKDK